MGFEEEVKKAGKENQEDYEKNKSNLDREIERAGRINQGISDNEEFEEDG